MPAFKRSKILFLLLWFTACSNQPNASSIITKAIEKHGGKIYINSQVSFTFRRTRYTALQQGGHFEYTRQITDSTGVIKDQLSNNGFQRSLNDRTVELSAADSSSYANSLNSVIYFALLPYKLNDAAVQKEYLGKVTIKDEPYYEIKVTFAKQGGGKDHEDTYMYWIHRKNHTMDYLAYRFHVNEGGTRFREAKNIRMIKGIRFADYNNWGGPDMETPLETYNELFEQGKLEKISEINLDDIEVLIDD